MATTYDTDLKKAGDGTWYRWLGEDEKGTKQNFRLGRDKAEANRRWRLIMALYETQTVAAQAYSGSWVPEQLQAAKQIAKGKVAKLPRIKLKVNETDSVIESGETYAKRLAYLNWNGDDFQPSDQADFKDAVKSVETAQKKHRITRAKLLGTNPSLDPTGQTIGQAIDAFIDHLRTKYTSDGTLTPWGKTQINQVKTWKRFMAVATRIQGEKEVHAGLLVMDLSDLTVAKAQLMVDTIASRPKTFESKHTKRMTLKTAGGIKKKIKHFFDWLDLTDEWQWWEPPRFRKLNYKIAGLTSDEQHERKMRKEKWKISDEEICILVKYATPSERVLILLGLNCAFGAGEIGNLRIPYVKLESKEIDGIRFKTGNETRHSLWPETVDALDWELKRRQGLPKSESSKDIVFLSEKTGKPLWKTSKAGNYNNGVAKRWDDLLDRVQKDHPKFHRYSFGKLRKTAAIRMIELHNAEVASMILAHGTPSDDKILSAYVNIPWKRLYAAQESYGESVRPLLVTERPPFQAPARNYIGLKKADKILQMYEDGASVKDIASSVGVSVMTVYRHLDRAGLKNKKNPKHGTQAKGS